MGPSFRGDRRIEGADGLSQRDLTARSYWRIYLLVYILNGILNLRRSSYTIYSDGVDIPLR